MAFPRLVSTVIGEARKKYADMTSADGLDYFHTAFRLLADAVDVRYKAQTLTITAGTREYDIPADVIENSVVYYQRTSDPTTWYQMYIRNKDELDIQRFGWRSSTQQQEPFEFYVSTTTDANTSKAVLGLVQLPNATSSGGYPCIGIFGQAVTDMLTSDTLPAFVNTDQYFVASIKRQYAEVSDTAMKDDWAKDEAKYLGQLTRHIVQLGAHQGTRLIPRWCMTQSSSR